MRQGHSTEGPASLHLTDEIIIQCSVCGRIYVVDPDGLSEQSFQENRQMGPEMTRVFFGERYCDTCGSHMRFSVTASEYPIGAYNYHSFESSGCEFVVDPTVELEYLDFDYLMLSDEEEVKASIDRTVALIEEARRDRKVLDDMTPREFEEFVADVFHRSGFDVELTQQTRDGGMDVIARGIVGGVPYMLLVECKHYGEHRPVGVSIVREVYGVMEDYDANGCVVVTTSRYSPEAREFAERHPYRIQLIGIDELTRLPENR